MTNYTKTTDFAAKDALPSGNSAKIVKGSEIDTEFNNIATASATKADKNNATLTGTTTFSTLSDGTISITAFVDEDDMVSNSAALLPTQQSVKAYVDSQVTAQDLDFQADTGGALSIDLDSETFTLTGGTGIDTSGLGNAVTFAIDSTVATLTGTQTLSNKTLSAPAVSGNLTTDGLIDGRDVATDGTKLDGIESGATADQTAAEIKTAYESNLNTNAFTDADESKLDGIESGATADQTAAEIRTLVEAATDSNVFTDADHTKLDGIEALADVTDTANVTAAGALMDSELTNITAVKALNQGVSTTDSPSFAGLTTAGLTLGATAITATGTELNYVDGVTSAIQTQLDAKAPTANPTFTGSFTSPGIDDNATSTAMTLDSSGNVGIGTSSPYGALTVDTANGILNIANGNTSGGTKIQAWGATPTNGYLAIEGYDKEYLRVDASGNVGIGASATLGAGLGYAGNTTSAGAGKITLYDASTGALVIDGFRAGYLPNSGIIFKGAGTERARIDASGRVGIGTSSPSDLLDISANGTSAMRLSDSSTPATYAQITQANGVLTFAADAGNAQAGSNMQFEVDGSERMRIDSSGNVGVGVTPQNSSGTWRNFEQGGMNLVGRSAGGADGMVGTNYVFKTDNSEVYKYTAGTSRVFFDDNEIKFQQAASGTAGTAISWSEAMRIDASGRMLIGTDSGDAFNAASTLRLQNTSLTNYIQMKGGTTATLGLLFGDTADDYAGGLQYFNSNDALVFNANNAERMRIDGSGNLLVGTTIANGTLVVSSSGGPYYTAYFNGTSGGQNIACRSGVTSGTAIRFLSSSGTDVGSIDTNGSTTSYTTFSDYRLKENVVAMSGATERIKQLKPSRFNFITEPDTTVDGFLAHEVQDIVPEAITGAKDAVDAEGNPKYQGIDQSKLVPLLVATIQELEARITQLENN